jgi:hypothetical protein
MFKKIVTVTALLTVVSQALAQGSDVRTPITAPGGDISFYIEGSGTPAEKITECLRQCQQKRIVLLAKAGDKPENNLTGFANLQLSPDASILYFESEGWATSAAIHAVDLKTGKERFFADGMIACVVRQGQYQGDLIIGQHRYFVQGGSYNPLNLYSPDGKLIGIVALDISDAPKFCRTDPLG